MNVSLVYPPFHLESLYSLLPLGLINLATGLALAGHRPTIHDAVLELREGALPMGPGLYPACAERILDAAPELIAFSAQCATYPAMIGVARELGPDGIRPKGRPRAFLGGGNGRLYLKAHQHRGNRTGS